MDTNISVKQVLQDTHSFYLQIKKAYEASDYARRYPLGIHWISNMVELLALIQRETDPDAKLRIIQETIMYSINTKDDDLKNRMVDWYIEYFKSRGVDVFGLDPSLQESSYSNPANCVVRGGRLFAPDFLRTVILALNVQRYCALPKGNFNILELGAGYGGLARTLKLFFPKATYVITDIPETLYFSATFLRLNFTEGKFLYVTEPSMLQQPLSNYDFVFVPTMFAEGLQKERFELFCNTASLGEMKNSVIRYWMDFVQNKTTVKYFYGLNRFLNTIDPVTEEARLDENCCSVSFDSWWRILQWQLDPPFARCPYLETLCSRNLEIIAERMNKEERSADSNTKRSKQLIESIEKQDWFTCPRVDNYRVCFEEKGESWPLTSTRASNDLSPDLTMNGTLFALWEAIRLNPDSHKVSMMLRYLKLLSRGTHFEEEYYYLDLLKTLTPGADAPGSFKRVPGESALLKRMVHAVTTRSMRASIKRNLERLYHGDEKSSH
ncbi:MAG: putative sugar O-methyltransferase [Verrucomicrobia bacterium]|nr:putative sugar O-methyltransferase [Verrucomicrobiota bacterium]